MLKQQGERALSFEEQNPTFAVSVNQQYDTCWQGLHESWMDHCAHMLLHEGPELQKQHCFHDIGN
eukprot:6300026-Amphidinium_carterae.1